MFVLQYTSINITRPEPIWVIHGPCINHHRQKRPRPPKKTSVILTLIESDLGHNHTHQKIPRS